MNQVTVAQAKGCAKELRKDLHAFSKQLHEKFGLDITKVELSGHGTDGTVKVLIDVFDVYVSASNTIECADRYNVPRNPTLSHDLPEPRKVGAPR